MIELRNIHMRFGSLPVLNGLNMSFEKGTITSILGPSGCGKSTLLYITAGLLRPTEGEVLGTEQKHTGFLFQEPRLLPWRNALENLEFVLPDEMDKQEKHMRSTEMIRRIELSGFEKHYPSQLSGGMNQRLALARAFIVHSDVLFMDEPFQSLDLKRREQIINLVRKLWLETKPAVLMVTHDVQEALLLSDKIYILSDKPTTILAQVQNTMAFHERTVKNREFYRMEQEIINNYIC